MLHSSRLVPGLKNMPVPVHYGVVTRGLPSKNVFCIAFSIQKLILDFKLNKNGLKALCELWLNYQIYETKNS